MITATVLDITNEIEREGWGNEKYTYTNRHMHCTDTKARLGCMYGERDGIAHSTASKTFSYFSSTRSCFFLCMKSDVCLLKTDSRFASFEDFKTFQLNKTAAVVVLFS